MSELLLANRNQIKNLAFAQAALMRELSSLERLLSGQGTVLVVDGQKSQRTLLLQAARMAGFEQILRAHQGPDALQYLYQNQVDMIVADWDTPVWGGIQLLDWVRCQPKLAHLLFVLAASPEQERLVVQVAEERHDLFISKPFSMDILKDRLPSVFHRRQILAAARLQELKGGMRQARESYLLAINNNPQRLWPYFSLGGLLGRNSRFSAAAQCYKQVQKLDVKAYAAALDLARLQELQGKAEKAHAMYSQLIKEHPWFLKPYDALSDSFLRQGQDRQAMAILERAVNWGGSQHAPRLLKLAEIYRQKQMNDKAIPLLEKSVQLRPWQQAGEKHGLLAEIYATQGQMEQALSHAQKGVEFSLETGDTRPALQCLELWGTLLARQGEEQAALQTWSQAFDPGIWGELPLSPYKMAAKLAKLARVEKMNNLAHYFYNLAQSMLGKGDSDWLEQRRQQLAELGAQGLRLVEENRLSEAEACYRQGLMLSPDSARLSFNLGKLHYRQGKFDSAQRYLAAARRLGQGDEELAREIKRFNQQAEEIQHN